MTYAEAVSFLDRLTNFERMDGYRYDSKNFGLDRTRSLLAAVGDPHRKTKCVIVAGTKGKGSTAAMLAALLENCGWRAGLYTSPHLVEYAERIRVGPAAVSREEFGDLAARVAGAVAELEKDGDDMRPTTFEVLTAMALLGFSERGVDAGILEVGMGGRLDAVNVVDAKAVCITAISLDHVSQLGETVEAIAREKAGVVKSAAPVVSGPQEPDAAAVLRSACSAAGAPLLVVGRDLKAEEVETGPEGTSCALVTPRNRYAGLKLNLLGRHQVDNALAALGTLESLEVEPGEREVRRALGGVDWPGRLQVLSRRPWLVLDGAHNDASARAVDSACRELFEPERVALVFGQLRGHDHAAVAGALCRGSSKVYLPVMKHPRALAPDDLAKVVRPHCGTVETFPAVPAAVAAARRDFRREDDLILVAGSLSLVGEVLAERNGC